MLLDLLYLLAGLLLTPYFAYRRWVKGKLSAPLSQRLGLVPERESGKPRIWIHAVSVGEAAAAETLIKALHERQPEFDVVVSTTTVTGQEVARKRYGADKVFHYPLDLSWVVRRALDRVRPTALVLMELEVWPNMTAQAALRGLPIIVVNGRISERAFRRYKRFWFLVGPSFRRVTRWLVQSDEYAARLKELGVSDDRIEISGNIKYDAIDVRLPSPEERQSAREKLGLSSDAPVLIGGSTHPTEEAALLDCFKQLRATTVPSLQLVLVPRHPERAAAVEQEISAAGFARVRFSSLQSAAKSQEPRAKSQEPSVLLVDTVGVLKDAYKAADVAFVGGSLIPHGGQNPMEPCGLGVPIVHGRHMHNFADAMAILRSCDGSVEVSKESLTKEIEKLLLRSESAKAMAGRARNGFLARQGATARAAECLGDMLRMRESKRIRLLT
ncbi:MAG TPA: 3-deoxy-D-manno-octulosonic acid transferase [Planctomycetota bacterium]|jgi:3-deoxy-D-manno-octulosonic-acid transferase